MGQLAISFVRQFGRAYEQTCGAFDKTRSVWLGAPRGWTDQMIGRADHEGVLAIAARAWVTENFGDQPHQLFFERRKVDLMIALGRAHDLCATTPVLLVEHENAHDVEVEAWNLSCWRVPLRVLVFYSDKRIDQPSWRRLKKFCAG